METAEARFVSMLVERMDAQERRVEALEAEVRQARVKARLHDDLHRLTLRLEGESGRFSDGIRLDWILGDPPRLDDEHMDAFFRIGPVLIKLLRPGCPGTWVGRFGERISVGELCAGVNVLFREKQLVPAPFERLTSHPRNMCYLYLSAPQKPWAGIPRRPSQQSSSDSL